VFLQKVQRELFCSKAMMQLWSVKTKEIAHIGCFLLSSAGWRLNQQGKRTSSSADDQCLLQNSAYGPCWTTSAELLSSRRYSPKSEL